MFRCHRDCCEYGLDDQDLRDQIDRAVREALGRGLTTPDDLRATATRHRYRHRRTVLPLIERAIHAATSALTYAPTA